MTLSGQTNSTTLNILLGVRRSDLPLPPPPSPPTFSGLLPLFLCPLSLGAPVFYAPTGCGSVGALLLWWGSTFVAPLFACTFRVWSDLGHALSAVLCPLFDLSIPFGLCLSGLLVVSVWCFCLCVFWCLSVSVALLSVFGWAPLFLSCFLAVVGSPPCQMLLPFPPRLVPCGALAQFVRWSLHLVASVTAWLPCFTAGSVAVLCRPYIILSHGSKGFWPCVGFVSPSPPCCMCC